MRNAPPFDWIGVIFIALALGCMELGADRGEDYDWLASSFIRVMFVLSVIGYVGGVTYLLYTKHPAVNLRVFKDRNFALSWFAMAMMGFVLYASAIIMPLFSQNVLGYSSVLAGWVLAPGAIVLCILIPIVSQLLNIVPVKWIVVAGGVALAASCYYSMGLVPDLDLFHVTLYRAAQTAALALLFVQISASAYSTIPDELKGDAASLVTMARNVYGGVGISVGTALVTDHLQIRQAHLIQYLDPTNQPYNALLQQVQQARDQPLLARPVGLPAGARCSTHSGKCPTAIGAAEHDASERRGRTISSAWRRLGSLRSSKPGAVPTRRAASLSGSSRRARCCTEMETLTKLGVNSLRYALLIGELSSFTLVVQLLDVRPSIVSRRIGGFEDLLGIFIFIVPARAYKPP